LSAKSCRADNSRKQPTPTHWRKATQRQPIDRQGQGVARSQHNAFSRRFFQQNLAAMHLLAVKTGLCTPALAGLLLQPCLRP